MDYYRTYEVEVRIARIFNSYGPRMNIHDGRVVSNFIVQALKGEDITIYGDGSQVCVIYLQIFTKLTFFCRLEVFAIALIL